MSEEKKATLEQFTKQQKRIEANAKKEYQHKVEQEKLLTKQKTIFMLDNSFIKGYPNINRLWFIHLVNEVGDGRMTQDEALESCYLQIDDTPFINILKETIRLRNLLISLNLFEDVLNRNSTFNGLSREDVIKTSKPRNPFEEINNNNNKEE